MSSQTLILADFPAPELARALSPNGRAHWRRRLQAGRVVATHVVLATTGRPLVPLVGRARLTVRWVFPQQRRRDMDNHATGVVKACADALVRLGILIDDDSAHLELAPVEIIVERGQRRMELTLEEIDA